MLYKDDVDRKRIEDIIGMTLQSLKTYRYIDSKTKSYQIQRGCFLLFIFLVHPSNHTIEPYAIRLYLVNHQAVPSGRMPSSQIIRS